MKTFILILTLFFSHLLADEKPIIADIYLFNTTDKAISIKDINEYDELFSKVDENSSWDGKDSIHWIKLKLQDDLKDGRYVVAYGGAEFDLASFSSLQAIDRFSLYGSSHVSFDYQKERDGLIYFVRLSEFEKDRAYVRGIKSESFYERLDSYLIYLLVAGLVLGLILMTAIYNATLYYYNHEKSFLYYALMQVFMVGVLFFHTGMPTAIFHFKDELFIYEYLSLFTALFAVLFARSFLNTKEYLPTHDKVLLLFLAFIVVDILYFPKPIIADFGLYTITTSYFLVVGYLRMKQGYKPARFFLMGWVAMVLGIFIAEYFMGYLYFDSMLLGSSIEAIFLAIALAYKIRQLQDEKEQ
jgi:hypothetical protein